MKRESPIRPQATAEVAADILLVEDDPNDAELTLAALSECGFAQRVEHVTDGLEALDYLAGTGLFTHRNAALPPRLILLDLGLHKMGGLQVLRRLKAEERTRSIPVVVLTSSSVAIELLESYRLGVNSYVLKPGDAKAFASVVAAIGNYWLNVNQPPP